MSRAVANIYTARGWHEIASQIGVHTLFPDHPVMSVQDVTDVVLWLASESAKHITGVALPVDGGFLAK
jgi:NAD(P)-dependent dehydrogenase (short-subunit alcohol dehydrogenase family)